MGAASGVHTVGGFVGSKSPLSSVWGDGLSDLEAHGYQVAKEIAVKANVAVLVVRRAHWPEHQFVLKAFAECSANELAKTEIGPLQEAMILRGLEHPNIVKYVEAWWTESGNAGRLSLVMEHAEDGDLHAPRMAMMRLHRHLEQNLLCRWLRQILEALAYLHNKGIAHRDLKTSNIFLKDSWSETLIGDFGISSVLSRSTFANASAGTPAYMSPEAVRCEPYGTAVDIWAVGIIMYELMTLQLPFKGSLLSLVYKIVFTSITEEPLTEAGFTKELIALVSKVLAKDAILRPSATVLLADEEFWNTCDLESSQQLAYTACSENRLHLLTAERTEAKVLFADSIGSGGTTGLPVLQSWASSEPTNAGSVMPSAFASPAWSVRPCASLASQTSLDSIGILRDNLLNGGDFLIEQDFVIRSAEASNVPISMPCTPSASDANADEALRKELREAHANGLPLPAEYLEDLLLRLGASNGVAIT